MEPWSRYREKTTGAKLRYEDFRTVTHDITLAQSTADAETIRNAARTCLKRVALDRKLRLLGVRASSLTRSMQISSPRAIRSTPGASEQIFLE
ncbi:MAG: hypothetical protein ACRD1T_14690 [Acidimicrobiia bacterium]